MKARTNGIEINHTIEGQGPWVVMSHSLACDRSMWDEQAQLLKSHYRVLRFDTRGHGGSDAPDGAYALDMFAEDLLGLLDGLSVKAPHFIGLSMGGMIGMTFALRYPGRFRSLVLCDTSSRIPPEAGPIWEGRIKIATEQGMEPLVEPTLQRWFTESFYQGNKPMMGRRWPDDPQHQTGWLHRLLQGYPENQCDGSTGCGQMSGADHRRRTGRRHTGGHVACDSGRDSRIRTGRDSVGVAFVQSRAAWRIQRGSHRLPAGALIVIPAQRRRYRAASI